MNIILEETFSYFKNFENKNLKSLEAQFSDDITLIDWEINAQGKNKILQINENFFNQISSIKILINDIFQKNNKIVAEILIILNNDIELNVVDILEFDKFNKIKKIYAYKR